MKILDRYILTTYLKTFISVFLILILIFILQTIWLYIKELAGKDLDLIVIIKFIFYFLPKLIPLVLPLTILLSSIMVFGSFAENYEFAAMKSTGISLQRAMSGLSIFIVILGFTTFLFANNVIPWSEFNSFNLRKNIAKLKPAMLLAEGQFNPVGNYNIKFAKKTDDNHLENVVIHIKGTNGRTNSTFIKSKRGVFIGKESSKILKLILTDGNYYNDIIPKKPSERKKHPFAKSTFEKYIINIDLSELNDVDIDDKSYSDKYNMLNLNGLDKAMDSLSNKWKTELDAFSKNLYQRTSIQTLGNTSFANQPNVSKASDGQKVKDSVFQGSFMELFDTKAKVQISTTAFNSVNSTKQIITSKETFIKNENVIYKKHIVSYHEKLALGFACIILFFVGAPLGALIRKGGIGLPMVVAILLFLTYHFIGIFATNSAKNGNFNPILASWFSTLIMLPLGVYLTRRATADRGLFEMGNILEPLREIFKIKAKDSVDYTFLESYKMNELVAVVNDHENLEHDENVRHEAIKLLINKGLTTEELIEKGVRIRQDFNHTQNITKHYTDHSKFAIVLYFIGIVLLILFFVFRNNKLPSLASASIQLSMISVILFIVYYIKSTINLFNFYKDINRKVPNLVLLIIGAPLYMITFPFIKVKVKEDLILNYLDNLK
ncbi:LptF/LptG family permease [Aestuariivivens sediminis]|uniref:LptF/LptG family permease n=1 Tax=Aestuariivivens sediminis TaxID=2913557 RepID=UPI001F59FE9F|nr:LptF/LptG family permease [Aestuariivivens sediminis]